mgnify:CR=1 FL=1
MQAAIADAALVEVGDQHHGLGQARGPVAAVEPYPGDRAARVFDERFEPVAEEDGLLLPQAEPRQRPVDGKHRSDQIVAIHRSPIAAVA